MTTPIHLDLERHKRVTEALAALKPCPYAHRITPDQIAIALGEFGDIWPESVVPRDIPKAHRCMTKTRNGSR